MSEWKEYKLGEVGEIITGKTPSLHNPEDWGNDFLFITPSDYCNYGKYAKDSIRKLSVSGLERLKKKVLPPKSILVTCIGSDMGKVVMNNVMCITNQQINAIAPYKEYDNDFVYYSLLNAYDTLRVLGGDGTAVPIVNKSDFENIVLKLPPLDEQKLIAGVLSSLDDKIELLHRENATLEALAETLFRHYFIENPNPDWKEGKVSDVAIHCKESINPQKHFDEIFLHYSIPAYDNGKRPIEEQGQSIQSNKYVIPQNCILFSKLNPHKDKRVWLILDDVQPNTICSTEFQIVKPQNNQWLYFLYEWLIYKENYDEIASGVSGTSGSHQRIDPKVIFENGCPIVDEFTLEQYNTKVKPIFEKIKSNQQRIQTLVIQRDMLLPRLMSGEVKIIEQ